MNRPPDCLDGYRNYGDELVSADQERRRTFIELQARFEAMDDEVEAIPFPGWSRG